MICPSCGQTIVDENPAFCPRCGVNLTMFTFQEETTPLPKNDVRVNEDKTILTGTGGPSKSEANQANFSVKYLGGHPAYPNPCDVVLKLEENQLVFGGLKPELAVPFSSVESIETTTREQVTLGRAVLVGLWSLAWKKKTPLMVVRFKDPVGLSHSMVFEAENIGHVQAEVYNRVVASRGA